jgi:alpha-tubulin suppressor-like RCC1 family protein
VAKVVELGDSTSSQDPLTLPVIHDRTGPSDVADLAAGWSHVLALDGQHRVWSWGDDSAGQLGTPDGTHAEPELVDIPLDGAAGFVKVAARANQSFALRSDGVVFAWGDNRFGALGLGSVELQDHPGAIAGLGHAVSVAAGERHAIALTEDGNVWAWGQNLSGQLGTSPSSTLVTTPAVVPSFYGSTFIAAGGFHSAAIDFIGNLLLWGDGFHAQLGTGGITSSYTPVPAAVGTSVTTVALGRFHSLAVLSGGKVSSFGDDSACQLGEGVIYGAWSPMPPRVPANAALVTAGDYDSLVVGTDGKAYGWGDDSRGALGASGPSYSHLACHPVTAQTGTVVLAAGGGAFTVLAVTD